MKKLLTTLLFLMILITPMFSGQFPFRTEDGKWFGEYVPPSAVYTNSLHEINYTAWLKSVGEWTFDDINSMSWTNGTTGSTNSSSALSSYPILNITGGSYITFTNAGWTNAIYYMSDDDRMAITNITQNAGVTQLTWMIWASHFTSEDYNPLMFQYKDDNNCIILVSGSTGQNLIGAVRNGNTYVATTSDNVWITSGGWHHIAMVYDGSLANESRIKIYVNGILKPVTMSGTISTTSSSDNGNVWLGYNPSANQYIMSTAIETPTMLAHYAMTSNEVYDVYNTTLYRRNTN